MKLLVPTFVLFIALTPFAGTFELDTFEDDDTPNQASIIGVGAAEPQSHNFDALFDDGLGDEDWVVFMVTESNIFSIETLNLGENADTAITLYLADAEGNLTFVTEDTLAGSSLIQIFLEGPATYFVRVTNLLDRTGLGTDYDLRVFVPNLGNIPGTIVGFVTSTEESMPPIFRAQVSIRQFPLIRVFTDSTGAYVIPAVTPGSYTLDVSAMGFQTPAQGITRNIGDGELIVQDFELQPEVNVPDPEDINGDNAVNAVDIQLVINEVLGTGSSGNAADTNSDGSINSVDIQLVINAVLGIV